MTGMDVFAAFCFVISVWGGVEYGAATERERADRRAQAAAERAADAGKVVDLNSRRGRAS